MALCTVGSASAQDFTWTGIGPYGGIDGYRTITVDSAGTIYALAVSGWAYRSTDDGANWSILPRTDFAELRAYGRDTLFASLGSSQFARSTDRGESWRTLNTTPQTWILLPDGNVLTSQTSAGRTHIVTLDSNGASGPVAIPVRYALNLIGLTGTGGIVGRVRDTMLLSTNGGVDWTVTATGIAPGGRITYFGADPGGVLYLVDDSSRIYRSTDDGANWSLRGRPMSESGWITGITLDAAGRLYVSAYATMRSEDGGASWLTVADRSFELLARQGNGLVGATADGGLFRSDDSGNTWQVLEKGLPGPFVRSIYAPGDTGVVYQSRAGHHRWSAAEGGRWDLHDFGALPRLTRADGERIVGYSPATRRLYNSSDAGASWTISDPVGPITAGIVTVGVDRTGAVVLGSTTTWRTTDLGATWQPLDTTASGSSYGEIRRDSSGRLLTFKQRSLDYYDEASQRWTVMSTAPPLLNGATALLTLTDGTIVIGTWNDGIHRSTDNGLTWQLLAAPAGEIEEIVADAQGSLVAHSATFGLFLSRDRGESWRRIGMTIPWPVTAVDIAPSGRIFAGTMIGVYRSEESVVGVEDDARIPSVLDLR